MKKYKATVFDTQKYSLGESPYYDARFKRYSWVDITKGCLWTLQDGVKTSFELGQPIGAAIPLPDSEGFLLCAMDGLYKYENGKAELFRDLTDTFKPYWRSNDAKLDPKGRLFFGASVADDHEAEGALFIYDNGDIRCLQKNTKISNGMAWSKDNKSFFFSDSLEYAVFKYDYNIEDGSISNRRKLFDVENGVSDGMCIDADDNIWVAVWGGSRIEKRDGETGEKLAEIEVSAEHVSSCSFMDDGKTLFITSSGDGLSGEYDGCLFTCVVD